MINGM
jgi:hypothetical protein